MMKALILVLFTLCSYTLFSQSLTVSGVVKTESGEPLIGVNVVIKGTAQGTTTNYDGKYELVVPKGDETLLFRFVGYISKEVVLNGQRNVNITLIEDIKTLGDVTVTGFSDLMGRSRKRLESIQSIPESVTALNAEQIEMTGVKDIGSFLTQIPGISYGESQDPGTVQINVRGIPQIRYGHSPIAVVVDGVYLADANLNTQGLFDIEQIEVVKGSQGIFYGKNAIGGAISITTKPMGNEFEGKFKVGQGNGNASSSTVSMSGALVQDKIFFRVAANYYNTDGLIKNTFLDQYVDFKTQKAIRGQLRFEIDGKSHLTVTGQRSYTRSGAITFIDSNHNDDFSGAFVAPFQPVVDGDPKSPNTYTGSPRGDFLGEGVVNTYFSSANFETNFSSFRLSTILSYTNVDLFYDGDYNSYGPVPDAYQEMKRGSKTLNGELRLTSTNKSPFQWSAGVFVQNIKSPWVTSAFTNNDIKDYEYSDVTKGTLTDDENKLTSFAPFAFFEYTIINALKVSVGARNEFETTKNTTKLFGGSETSRSYSVFQPKASISYNITKDIMPYASYSGGFRSGGYNASSFDNPNGGGGVEKVIRHETSKSFEGGIKTSFFKNRIILNMAYFKTKYHDQQAYRFGYGNVDGDIKTGDLYGNESFLGTINLSETEIKGFEIDIKARVAKFLDIIGGYSSIDSEIVEAGVIGGFDEKANNGNATPFTLASSWNIGLLSRISISKKVKLNSSLNFENKGKKFWFAENYLLPQKDVFQDPYTLINARIAVGFQKINIGLWVKNLGDKKYNIEWWPLSAFGNGDIRTPSQPRTYGIDISYTF